jgi:2-keto-3-deoxy-L-rhamnonate aldolase RhmA
MEHTTFDLHDVQAMVMAAERVGVTPIVRTPGFDPAFILRLLDIGVQGVQVPHVSSAAVAREAVKAVRYPPEGERGMAAGSRAANFGKTPLLEHMAQSNREVLLACMIEDMEAVEQIEEIAAVDGVDLLAVGPSDLSRSLGVSGHPDHPKLIAAIDRVHAAVRNGGQRPSRDPAQPRRPSAQRRPAQGTRRRLYELRPDPGGAASQIAERSGGRTAEAAGIKGHPPRPRHHRGDGACEPSPPLRRQDLWRQHLVDQVTVQSVADAGQQWGMKTVPAANAERPLSFFKAAPAADD